MNKAEIYSTLNDAYFSGEPHEKGVIDHLPLLLHTASVVVDAGASLGQYTLASSQLLRGGEVHAIEADPIRFEELARNCAKWQESSGNKVIAHHCALTDRVGQVSYFVTNSSTSGGLERHDTGGGVDWDEITVPSDSLDHLFAGKLPDFVKIDVEGAELSVLQGAQRILSDGNAVFLIELHDWLDGAQDSQAVMRLMRSHSYLSADFFGRAVFVKDRRLWVKLKLMELRRPARLLARIRAHANRTVRRSGGSA